MVCQTCGGEFTTRKILNAYETEHLLCPVCDEYMAVIPVYETPEQYKARTGEEWPDAWPVWNLLRSGGTGENPVFSWDIRPYDFTKLIVEKAGIEIIHVCANGPEPPPNAWRPV